MTEQIYRKKCIRFSIQIIVTCKSTCSAHQPHPNKHKIFPSISLYGDKCFWPPLRPLRGLEGRRRSLPWACRCCVDCWDCNTQCQLPRLLWRCLWKGGEKTERKRENESQTGVARRTYLGTDASAPDVLGRTVVREGVGVSHLKHDN